MATNVTLLRSLSTGGANANAAAQELLRRGQTGQASPAELREAQQLTTNPALKDAFAQAAATAEGPALNGRETLRDVSALQPDTSKLNDAKQIPEKFLGDFQLLKGQLLGAAGLTRAQKAERLFQFFTAYAERFQQLSQNPNAQLANAAKQLQQAMNPAEYARAMQQFDKAFAQLGFQQLVTSDGRTGQDAARQMLQAPTAEAFAQARPEHLDAPAWQDNAAVRLDAKPAGIGQHAPVLLAQQPLSTRKTSDDASKQDDAPGGRRRDRKGVLGNKMVWNVLHLLRGEDLTDVERKDAMTQLAVAATLLLVLGSILVGVLVWM